jgi:enoyl-CoA hydratase/3-hydroxyacyl-CoA dehydrogenase
MMTSQANTSTDRPFDRLAVVGAGNMGSGIAQKMATEGFSVTLVDLDDEKVARGMGIINKTLADAVQRGIFSAAESAAIGQRITGTTRFEDLAGVDLVVEAVFEDLDIKKRVFSRPRPRGPSAWSDCTTSIIRPRTASSRSSPGGRPTRSCIAARGAFRRRLAKPRLPRAIPTASSSIGSSCRG